MSEQTLSRVRAVVAELAGCDPRDVSDASSFVELGMDSLQLTQLAARVEREFGTRIPFRDLLGPARTVASLAERLPTEAADVTTDGHRERPVAVADGLVATLLSQLDVMRSQLDRLSGATSPAPRAGSEASARVESAPVHAARETSGRATPPASGSDGTLTAHQEAAIASFARAWNQRTARSKALIDRQRDVHADPRTAAGWSEEWKDLVYPVVVERSAGAYLWDVDGNRYIDLLNGFGPTFLGHSAPLVTEALREQMTRGFELGPQTPLAGEAARLICEMTGLDRAAFTCTGSEAVQSALRIARTITGRSRVAIFAGDYHGNFDEVLVRRGPGRDAPRSVPAVAGVPQRAVDDIVVLEFGAPESLDWLRANVASLAAVMAEPIQTRNPHLRPREFIQEIRALTRDAGAVLIFDEVVTGFRLHAGGAQAYYGVEADLVTYGKVVGGGLPIGVIAGRRPFIDVLDGGPWHFGDESGPEQGLSFFAGTFVRHPLAIAAAHATLTYLRDAGPTLQEGLNARAAELVQRLNATAETAQAPVHVYHCGSVLFVRCTAPSERLNTFLWYFLRDEGVFLLEGYPSYLSLAHSDEDLEAIVGAFGRAITRMYEADFWPRPAARPSAGVTERFAEPPVPGARLGQLPNGNAAWFVEDAERPGHFVPWGGRA